METTRIVKLIYFSIRSESKKSYHVKFQYLRFLKIYEYSMSASWKTRYH